jgi:hypothetical protein
LVSHQVGKQQIKSLSFAPSQSSGLARKGDGAAMDISIPQDPDTQLTRGKTAAALTAAGFPIKPKTLATKATRGGGPPYRLFGPRAIYRWGDALEWAQARLTEPRTSTSAKDVA